MLYKTNYDSILGKLTIVCDLKSLRGLYIEGQKYFASNIKEELVEKDNLDVFECVKQWLFEYFKGNKPDISELSFSIYGSEFQKLVWKILCEIPYGKVTTYGEIAAKIAKIKNIKKMSAQAVGAAIGHNPISIIIPCHRVVGADGNLTGYAGGIDKKIKLLEHEKADMTNYFILK